MTPVTTPELVEVRLFGLPLQLHARAQQQADAMRREFQLIVEQAREDTGSVPRRLLELSTVLSARYEGFSAEQEASIDDAVAAGLLQLDELVFYVPADAGEAPRQLGHILDEADDYCRQGRLLTFATPPELVAYRQWYLDNFIEQCAAGPAQPWVGTLH